MSKKIAILGIHTDIGKTVTAAIMTEALHADYWKPLQAGDLDNSDRIKVKRWITNKYSVIHPEAIKLLMPASPHTAAAAENCVFDFKKFQIPKTENTLLIETAGGIFSPIDDKNTMLDFVQYFQWPVVLVSRNYLGSINHTLLCLNVLKQRGVKVLALIVNGKRNESSESFIKNYSNIEHIMYIKELATLDKEIVQDEAIHFRTQWERIGGIE
ncbi:dethiobiotin synthase [Arachidicoccus soli]|uniref:ATP-dependent dethiobiotin synthetase BioD n=1 Tax=Arachidicoccus soli TaxID=2341117 RepID=A0A386HPE1_9BACT|nr:dethiobiotin synthase [Arachidicoccus soli]AYD47807.1 dethiobiotin synthase [Arachidicoccus soli]